MQLESMIINGCHHNHVLYMKILTQIQINVTFSVYFYRPKFAFFPFSNITFDIAVFCTLHKKPDKI